MMTQYSSSPAEVLNWYLRLQDDGTSGYKFTVERLPNGFALTPKLVGRSVTLLANYSTSRIDYSPALKPLKDDDIVEVYRAQESLKRPV
jgi:hypothetical protein